MKPSTEKDRLTTPSGFRPLLARVLPPSSLVPGEDASTSRPETSWTSPMREVRERLPDDGNLRGHRYISDLLINKRNAMTQRSSQLYYASLSGLARPTSKLILLGIGLVEAAKSRRRPRRRAFPHRERNYTTNQENLA